MIFYVGKKVDVVDDKVRKRRNQVNSWAYGYDESIDTVIISKDGTLGEVYHVSGINIGLPEKPDHKEIINWDKTIENQFWKREELPRGLDEETHHNKEYRGFIESQFDKKENGVWIYLNGKAVHLTGLYWYFLQWVKIEEEYPNLRVIQNELMLFWEACKADKRSLGMIYCKNRRIGASSLAVAEELASGTSFNDKKLGIISKTGDDAKDIFDRIVTSYMRLPSFFQPEYDGNNVPQKVLVFRKKNRKRSKDDTAAESKNLGLNTMVKWFPTTKNAMDGWRIFRSLLDESAKWLEVNFEKYWNKVKTSHIKGRVVFGKSMVVSTINPMDEGGQEFKNVYDNSDANERNANGQTKSGLYKIFIAARYCLEGFFDKYGFSIVEDPEKPVITDVGDEVTVGSITFLKNVLEELKGDGEGYNEQLRQFPECEDDAFRPSAEDCAFNVGHLLEQEHHNQTELNDRWIDKETWIGNDEVERGNFQWAGGQQDTTVVWVPDAEKGRFYIAKGCHPKPEDRNQKVMKFENGVSAWAPVNEAVGGFGIDPYDRSKAADGRGSKGAIHLRTKMNTWHFPNNAFVLEYIDRPPKVDLFYEDVIMAMVYFSMPILPELSCMPFSRYINARGYRNFVKNNPFKTWDELGPNEKEFGGMPPQNADIGLAQFYAIEAEVNDRVGVARNDTYRNQGEMAYNPFTRTIIQWKKVDPDKRTKYDAYISSSLAIICNQSRQQKKPEPPKPVKVRSLLRTYNNNGNISVRR